MRIYIIYAWENFGIVAINFMSLNINVGYALEKFG